MTRVGILSAHVGDEENKAEHDAEGTDHNIADSEEVVGTTEDIRSGEHEVLAASEGAHIVLVLNCDSL